MTVQVPLSAQQEVFLAWMYERDEPRHPAPICAAIRIVDEFSTELLERSLADVIQRHEALRMVFTARRDGHQATILDRGQAEVRRIIARGSDAAERLADAGDIAERERARPFDLALGPLVRATIVEIGGDDRILLLCVHHLVFDAWSMSILLRELGMTYSGLRAGRTVRLAPPAQFTEITRQSRACWPDNRTHWRETLAGAADGLEFFPGRKTTDSLVPRSSAFPVDRPLVERIRRTARANSATPFMVVLAAWVSVLSSWSGQTDILMMSPMSGRTTPGSETAVGCLFTALILRVDLSGYPDFPELLGRVRSVTSRATELHDYPYAEFQRQFPHAPCVGYYRWTVPLHFPGLDSDEFDLPVQLVDDLEIPGRNRGVPHLSMFDQHDGSIRARLLFNETAFEEKTIEQLGQELLDFTRQVC
jgi:hypothetical protein